MRTAYDDILADGLKRRHPVQQIIGALLKAEIADKTARSIKYRPEVEVYFGHFLSHRVRAPLVQPVGNQRTAEIVRTEEKGSDINLAVHLLNDGWLDAYDCAVVVSNDSDIAEAMRLTRQHHAKRIGLVTPGSVRPLRQLMAHADFSRHTRSKALQRSQFPDPIPGTNIRKPARW